MKAAIISGAATGAGILVLAGLTGPASATITIGDGATKAVLAACSTDKAQTKDRVENCSYIYLTSLSAASANNVYTYPTSSGTVSWQNGTVSAAALNYPATGQTWPQVKNLILGATATVTPKNITGTIDTASNKVTLNVPFDITLSALGNDCALSGTATLTSDATDPKGGGVGKAYDPASGSFAVAAATPPTLTKTDGAGLGCAPAALLYDISATGTMGWYRLDLSRGVGVYAAGVLTLGGTSTGASAGAQTATFDAPKRIARKGSTVILRRTVMTNAGQRATATLSWSTKKSANGSSPRFASSRMTRSGKLTLKTTGSAKRLYVRLTVTAPATPGFQELLVTRKWVVR